MENTETIETVETETVSPPIIPINSGSLLVDERTSRFSSAIWYTAMQRETITLAGLGGIGSYVGFLLARLKPAYIRMFDPDVVEAANMSGQLYGVSNLGQTKIYALQKIMQEYAEYYSMCSIGERFTSESVGSKIMICGFDNMEARKIFYDSWISVVNELPTSSREGCLFIDGRLAAEEFQVFAIQGDDIRSMEVYKNEWLFEDSKAEETICSYKQTTFMANMIASVMVNILVNFVSNKCDSVISRTIPFMTSYSGDNMYFKVEL